MKSTRAILFTIGLIALISAVLGYSGLYRSLTRKPYHDQRLEFLHIIDAAQIWYVRPHSYDGGGRSFIGLDFERLGLSEKKGAVTWVGEYGKYYLDRVSGEDFDMRSESPRGYVIEVKNVRYDARPKLLISKER